MNWVDIALMLLVLAACFQGYRQGLVLQVLSLVSTVLSLWLAYTFADNLAPYLKEWLPFTIPDRTGLLGLFSLEKVVYSIIAFLLIFLFVRLILRIVRLFIDRIFRFPILSAFNQTGGLVFGFVRILILIVILINVLHVIPVPTLTDRVNQSFFAQHIIEITPSLKEELITVFQGKLS